MSIEVNCEDCREPYRVKVDFSAKKIRCPSCKEILIVPASVQEFYVDDSIQTPSIPIGPNVPSGR